MKIYRVASPEIEIFFLNKEEAEEYRNQKNIPYEQWRTKKKQIKEKWAEKEEIYKKNWRKMKEEMAEFKTGNVVKDTEIEDTFRKIYEKKETIIV